MEGIDSTVIGTILKGVPCIMDTSFILQPWEASMARAHALRVPKTYGEEDETPMASEQAGVTEGIYSCNPLQ